MKSLIYVAGLLMERDLGLYFIYFIYSLPSGGATFISEVALKLETNGSRHTTSLEPALLG